MSDLYWGHAETSWANPGYRLRIQHRLPERKAQVLEARAQSWLNQHFGEAAGEVQVLPSERDGNGLLELTSEMLFQLDPAKLRAGFDMLAEKSVKDVDEAIAIEIEQAEEFVRVLKQQGT
jgi:hypothetical protein